MRTADSSRNRCVIEPPEWSNRVTIAHVDARF
jgi:hypothetical protein